MQQIHGGIQTVIEISTWHSGGSVGSAVRTRMNQFLQIARIAGILENTFCQRMMISAE